MANEITITYGLAVSKPPLVSPFTTVTRRSDMSGAVVHDVVQAVGTSEEAVSIGDVGTPGLILMQNLDATNYVEVGLLISSTFHPIAKLAATASGASPEPAMFRVASGATLYARANAGACNVRVRVVSA